MRLRKAEMLTDRQIDVTGEEKQEAERRAPAMRSRLLANQKGNLCTNGICDHQHI
jgi:hypothetical protein